MPAIAALHGRRGILRPGGSVPWALQLAGHRRGHRIQQVSEQAAVLETWLASAGTSWMGIVNHDDRRCVDALVSPPEVDRNRIGCSGLSGGGYRATCMTGMEPRFKASVIVGRTPPLSTTRDIPCAVHSSLFDAFSAQ